MHRASVVPHHQIAYLPADIAVEVPALVDGDGVHGVALGRFPRGIAGLLLVPIAVAYGWRTGF